MDRAEKFRRTGEWLWFLAVGIASSVWCVTAAGQLGATVDEPFYLDAGLKCWRTGCHQYLLGAGTMPLPGDVATLPLYLAERWRGSPIDLAGEFERWLPWARAGTLVFRWLLLFYGWRAARQIGGPWAGALAVALLACEPNLLAHSGLATTDLAISACLLALVYHFRTGRDGGWVRRVGIPTLWFAAALLSKTSGLVLGPLCLMVVECERLARAGCFRRTGSLAQRGRGVVRQLLPVARDLAVIGVCGLLLALAYCSDSRRPFRTLAPGKNGIPEGRVGKALVWIGEHGRSVESVYKATLYQINHNRTGHGGTYLLGRTYDRPIWYYFPLVLCIKLALPLLALPLVLAVVRPRALTNWACVAALALLAASPTFRVQIGVRFVLPLVALAVVGLAAATVRAWRDSAPGWRRRAGAIAALVSVIGVAWSAASAWPDGLRYTNELWGGPEQGYRLLSDSNYDWGQGLKELARWQRRHGAREMDLWYFGADPFVASLPVRVIELDRYSGQGPEAMLDQVRGHYLAASLTWVYGAYRDRQEAARFLRQYRPVARTSTFVIYDFTHPTGAVASPDGGTCRYGLAGRK
jgi:hypothetical protein